MRFSEHFEASGEHSHEVLVNEDNFLSKTLLAFFPAWDGHVVLNGHEDLVVLKRPCETAGSDAVGKVLLVLRKLQPRTCSCCVFVFEGSQQRDLFNL